MRKGFKFLQGLIKGPTVFQQDPVEGSRFWHLVLWAKGEILGLVGREWSSQIGSWV